MTNERPSRESQISKRLDKSYSEASRHEHFHGRSGQTAGEMQTGFYGDATSDLAYLLSELASLRERLKAAEAVVSAALVLDRYRGVAVRDNHRVLICGCDPTVDFIDPDCGVDRAILDALDALKKQEGT